MDNILELVRELVTPSNWSRGVELARNGNFYQDPGTPVGESIFRVVQGPRDRIVTVTLYPNDELWRCDCAQEEDPCRHVVATILAIKQGKVSEQSKDSSQTKHGVVHYVFTRVGKSLGFKRYIAFGDERVAITRSLADMRERIFASGRAVVPSEPDLMVDYVAPRDQEALPNAWSMSRLLPALSRVSNVFLDRERVSVAAKGLIPPLEVVDEGGGFRLRLAMSGDTFEYFDNGALLRGGGELCHYDISWFPDLVSEALARREPFAGEEETFNLVNEVLPLLSGDAEVIIKSDKLPKVVELKPRVVLNCHEDSSAASLTVVPQIVYGNPVLAELREGRLTLMSKVEVPLRNVDTERWLERGRIELLGLTLERARVFRDEAAIGFIIRLKGEEFKDIEIRGLDDSKFTEVTDLIPRGEFTEGGFVLSFQARDLSRDSELLSSERVLRGWRSGDGYLRLDNGGWAKLPTSWLSEHSEALEKLLTATKGSDRIPVRMLSEVEELCDALAIEPPIYLKRLIDGLKRVSEIPDASLPSDLNASLRGYQRSGVNWISFLLENDLGALLADDMGLGKTLQALCVVGAGTLVVAPTSVLSSWQQQIAQFRPGLTTNLYHGPKRALVKDVDITLTSYAIMRMDIDLLAETNWNLVVLDEAQMIRNPASQVASAAYRLKAGRRLCMSGTPVENSLDDIWSSFKFLNPGLLGSYSDFQGRFVEPIKNGDHQRGIELRRRVMPFVMRRHKRDVATELPPKTEVVLQCELSKSERVVYQAVLGSVKRELLEKIESGVGVLSALEVLLRLRQACCHLSLVPGHSAASSSKVDLLMEALQSSVAQGHRALVFSQWTSLLDLIEPHLNHGEISFCRIDGSTEGRGEIVNLFQSDVGPSVMLLSLKAGGLGLTLTAADHVYIVDPWWNPAAEEQAADRAYRIGQRNSVIVHRLVAKDTIEERILAIQEEKRKLLTTAIGESGTLALSRGDILGLLRGEE
jgi:superfamily II DNA or RNA helicase